MLDAITTQLSPTHRKLADRSIAASAGALFGLTFCAGVAMLSGRMPFALDLPMLTLYSSAVPLSVAGFMVHFSKSPPKLPILATLWFLAVFVPGLYFSEAWTAGESISLGGLQLRSENFVGFRAIAVAAMSGIVFSGIRAEGGAFENSAVSAESRTDWDARHREAVSRLASVDVNLRERQAREMSELEAFDRLLRAEMKDEVELVELEAEVSIESTEEVAA